MDLYIYYRAPLENARRVQELVCGMQANLTKNHGVASELKRRPVQNETQHTWMEVYRDIPDDFSAILQLAVSESGLMALIDGERHTEQFLDFSSCV